MTVPLLIFISTLFLTQYDNNLLLTENISKFVVFLFTFTLLSLVVFTLFAIFCGLHILTQLSIIILINKYLIHGF